METPKTLLQAVRERNGTWYWRIWWWIGYHGVYQVLWVLMRKFSVEDCYDFSQWKKGKSRD